MAQISQQLAATAVGVTTENMGEKVRVHALAKALGVPSAEMIAVLDSQGYGGKKATSTLPKADVETVLASLRAAAEPEKARAKKAGAKKTAAKKAPAKKAPAKKVAAKKAPAGKNAPEPAADAVTVASAEEETAPAPAKKAAAKKAAAGKTTAKKTAAKKTTDSSPQPVEAVEFVEPVAVTGPDVAEQAQAEAQEQQDTAKKTGGRRSRRSRRTRAAQDAPAVSETETPAEPAPEKTGGKKAPKKTGQKLAQKEAPKEAQEKSQAPAESAENGSAAAEAPARVVRRRVIRRVGSRTAASDAELLRRRRAEQNGAAGKNGQSGKPGKAAKAGADDRSDSTADHDSGRRRGRRGAGRGRGVPQDTTPATPQHNGRTGAAAPASADSAPRRVTADGVEIVDEPVKLKGSTRLASKRLWRQEQNQEKSKVVSRAEFKAHRENLYREMVVRDSERSDHPGTTTQVALTEDGQLVEHFVTSDTQSSTIGNIYLGRVQNVLASMEAAFIDIGTGRNAVLYASEVNWHSPHLHSKNRKIEQALKNGDQVLVQVIKDPIGHKGARLTNRISFAGRFLVYLPGGKTHGISRRLPEGERKRLKKILTDVVPSDGGTIIRTAAEGVSEEMIAEDVDRLDRRWTDIQAREEKARNRKGTKPETMYEEPNMLVKVIRDIFTEDINELVVDGEKSWQVVRDYVHRMAPDLEDRLVTYDPAKHDGKDVFADRKIDEQLTKALSRKVWLPSGGYLIIDPTEAMTVIDVNTGSFVGSGGNLEETVTKNNIEAAEEIVRQMRLRDMGGMIVVDFIDMVLPENRELVLRRLTENLAFDRTRHKVSEVTSLGLVQMTRKRLGTGLLDTYSTVCEHCEGRGIILHDDPVEHSDEEIDRTVNDGRRDHNGRSERRQAKEQAELKARYEKAREDADGEAVEVVTEHKADLPAAVAEATAEQVAEPEAEPAAETEAATGQRRRRRVVRRIHGQHHGDTAEQATQEQEPAQDDLSDIAASAIAHAGEIDPEEPTGADYVADQSTDTPVTAARTQTRRDRRGRRRVVRTTTQPETQATAPTTRETDAETVAESATEPVAEPVAEPESPAGPRGSYAAAKAEFDASPRRRRRTRGASRSDVPPQPEDYLVVEETPAAPADEAAPSRGARQQEQATQSAGRSGGDAPHRGGRRGGRRRVVRRSH
ncbi:translation initiation factor IF-2 N-terminal domain-containing protein [Corynebacterium nuruki]|uniref:translation initiation factor IF-2 N-terminal domain-containing protein n=1 Tax=Corynebacterium nuruki TaxID=1032851 RepID=UPI0002DEE23E|nr:translation initiation factor IF-2 N-terminal domain-containing protein [Corynebacterium nuruki]